MFVKTLLDSPKLPSLISTNTTRLAEAYSTLSSFFRSRSIPYIPCANGMYIFAQLAVGATSWEEEAELAGKLKEAGVLVSQGKAYHGPEGDKGWMRVGFAVEKDKLVEAVKRMDAVLGEAATNGVKTNGTSKTNVTANGQRAPVEATNGA